MSKNWICEMHLFDWPMKTSKLNRTLQIARKHVPVFIKVEDISEIPQQLNVQARMFNNYESKYIY